MAILSTEMNKALPLLQQVAPEFPRTSRRAMEALDETVVTLKALQKSFILRGGAKEVREEEAARDRVPASTKDNEKK
jgi:phospholipid/cholesterol/gamma-HCH transport system substrate-binding protein